MWSISLPEGKVLADTRSTWCRWMWSWGTNCLMDAVDILLLSLIWDSHGKCDLVARTRLARPPAPEELPAVELPQSHHPSVVVCVGAGLPAFHRAPSWLVGRARRLSAVCSAVAPTIPSKALVGSLELSWPLQQLARRTAKLHCPLRQSAPIPPVDGMISSISCRPPTLRFMSGLLEGTTWHFQGRFSTSRPRVTERRHGVSFTCSFWLTGHVNGSTDRDRSLHRWPWHIDNSTSSFVSTTCSSRHMWSAISTLPTVFRSPSFDASLLRSEKHMPFLCRRRAPWRLGTTLKIRHINKTRSGPITPRKNEGSRGQIRRRSTGFVATWSNVVLLTIFSPPVDLNEVFLWPQQTGIPSQRAKSWLRETIRAINRSAGRHRRLQLWLPLVLKESV